MAPLNFIDDYIERMAELNIAEKNYSDNAVMGLTIRLMGDLGSFASILWGISAVLRDRPNWRNILGAGITYGLSAFFKYSSTLAATKREGGIAVVSSMKSLLNWLDKDKEHALSLKGYCDPCGATCCRHGEAYGAPIVSGQEKDVISDFYRKKHSKKANLFDEINIGTGHYYVVKEIDGRCYSLDKNNNCTLQEAKPLDCLIYPIKAIYDGDERVLVIDTQCPASKHLSPEFIEAASSLAMKSIGMFSQQAYQHWIDNNISWVQPGRARRLEEWLRER